MLFHDWKVCCYVACIAILESMIGAGSVADAASSNGATPEMREWEALERMNLNAGSAIEAMKEARERYGDSVDYRVWIEKTKLEYRQKGLTLWRRYPNDARRYSWLYSTLSNSPRYWRDIHKVVGSGYNPAVIAQQIDETAQAAWDRELIALRVEGTAAPNEGMRNILHEAGLVYDIDMLAYLKSKGQPVSVNLLLMNVMQYCARADVEKRRKIEMVWHLFTSYYRQPRVYGVNVVDDSALEAAVIKALLNSPNEHAREIGEGFERFMALRQAPMELTTVRMDGRTSFDLAKHRGKIVLIDIWSIGCGACISAMPHLQSLYEKYGSYGFEVVGICRLIAGGTSEKHEWDTARRAVESKDARYPQALVYAEAKEGQQPALEGVALNREFANRYAFVGDPTMFFLDRSGRLASLEVSKSQLEDEIRKLLGLPPLSDPMQGTNSGTAGQ